MYKSIVRAISRPLLFITPVQSLELIGTQVRWSASAAILIEQIAPPRTARVDRNAVKRRFRDGGVFCRNMQISKA